MRRLFRFLLGLAACGVLVFATVNLLAYVRESNQSTNLNENLIEKAVAVNAPAPQLPKGKPVSQPEPDENPLPGETAPIAVDFDALWETNQDVVGWLYCEDTPINLPLVQAEDNSYYLHRLLDGTWNSAGTLFVDCRNAGDFSDKNTIIYGHNMKNKEMFGTLSNYREQFYYEAHPIMWLLTPEESFQLALIAGYVAPYNAEIYSFGLAEGDISALMEKSIKQSTFQSGFQPSQADRYVTLSTCSYEYDNARYVLIGCLRPLASCAK